VCTVFFWQGNYHTYSHIRCVHGIFLAGKLPHIQSYIGLARTIYIRCTYGIFGLEITKYTVYIYEYTRFWPTLVIYGVCTVFFWQGNYHTYRHIRCVHGIFWQGSYHTYSHIQCVHGTFSRGIITHTAIYDVHLLFWPF